MDEKAIQTAIDALHALRFVRRHYASGPDAATRMQDITAMLKEAATNTNAPFLGALASAIEAGWSGKSFWESPTA